MGWPILFFLKKKNLQDLIIWNIREQMPNQLNESNIDKYYFVLKLYKIINIYLFEYLLNQITYWNDSILNVNIV